MRSCRELARTSSGRLHLQQRDRRLHVDLYLQRVMTRDKIVALGYFGSVPRCNNRLRKLLDHGYLRRYEAASRGSGSQALYGADRESCQIIAGHLDLELNEVARATRDDVPPLFLDHTLGLVDLRIRFERE